ncbi:MAG: ribosomal protein S18-alanine N-acetyltransferase [Myxococcales bacterium]|nr:ribosomal protein S18-alanine N-acetyltransferase [Myxococcales bacterium]
MTLRRMRAADAEAVVALTHATLDAHYSAESLRVELSEPNAHQWVLCEGDQLVAWLDFRVVLDEVELIEIAVAAARRRQGHGRRLMDHLIGQGRDLGAAVIHLEVRADNAAARALYEAFGFGATGLRRRYYRDGADAVLYQLLLARHGA